ncbi:chromate transporter [Kaistia algarum]|uniref:chromate efflux transporter n=1 Tax=Kaistia algarum TaxID=2083279 RepID=UPI000CE85994|nr:chromate efflux transporter [Kaistia algarum]MCX5514163.1 chromate efflux transporter [Kaistia algarum]PPE77924.1 chromate transporter [Kaistia algarum]
MSAPSRGRRRHRSGPVSGGESHSPAETLSPVRIFAEFLRLGLTSFGGPIAHIGYFRERFVARLRWLDEAGFADLVALCQFLPGPASSQLGMAIGLQRGGLAGALAAFVGFTLPSALLMTGIGLAVVAAGPSGIDHSVLAGLAIVALAVVAEAVRGMAMSLARGRLHGAIALLAAAIALAWPSAGTQIAILLGAGLAGWWFDPAVPPPPGPAERSPVSHRLGALFLAVFFLLLVGLPLVAAITSSPLAGLVSALYRSGALVFGGGHVVLPLLQNAVVAPGLVSDAAFVAGYGAAQAMPGPLFSLAAFLGTVAGMPSPLAGALIATLALFAPSWLLVVGVLPFWLNLKTIAPCRKALAGVNAAVVGLLGAALYDPVFRTAIHGGVDLAAAVLCYALLTAGRVPAWVVVPLAAIGGYFLL